MGLKIAMISPFFVRCGIASYTMELSKALAKLGCEIWGVRLPRFGRKAPEILQTVVDAVPIDKVDLVHVQEEYGLFQGLEGSFFPPQQTGKGLKQLNKPVVTTMHATGNFEIDPIIASNSDRVIVHNEYCARRFRFPCVIIPHAAKPEKCMPIEEAKRSLGIPIKAPVVGYLGFISSYKNIELLIEAIQGVPDTALLIGGGWHVETDTPYIENLKRRTLEVLPARCQWLGFVEDERLSTAYGAMDVVVYPSFFATESGALIMALSHGKAVIASNVPPFREHEKRGTVITFRDVKDLRRKIRRLLKDADLRRKLEEAAWQYVQKTSWPEVAKLHQSLYEDTIEKWRAKTKYF